MHCQQILSVNLPYPSPTSGNNVANLSVLYIAEICIFKRSTKKPPVVSVAEMAGFFVLFFWHCASHSNYKKASSMWHDLQKQAIMCLVWFTTCTAHDMPYIVYSRGIRECRWCSVWAAALTFMAATWKPRRGCFMQPCHGYQCVGKLLEENAHHS